MDERFIWHEGELEHITKEELEKMGYIPYKKFEDEYPCKLCRQNTFCNHNCENYYQNANMIANSIFEKYFSHDETLETLKNVLDNLISEIKPFLPPQITLTKGLFLCIKIRLINLVDDETMIDIPLEIRDKLI